MNERLTEADLVSAEATIEEYARIAVNESLEPETFAEYDPAREPTDDLPWLSNPGTDVSLVRVVNEVRRLRDMIADALNSVDEYGTVHLSADLHAEARAIRKERA